MSMPAASAGLRADALPVAARDDRIDVATLTDLRDFVALADEWNALFRRAATPQQVFQDHTFLARWADHYLCPRTSLSIVIGRRRERLVMVWPLVRQRWLGIDVLRFMGVPVAQFGDVLVDPDEDIEALLDAGWKTVRTLGVDLFEARKVRADAALANSSFWTEGQVVDSLQAPFADLGRRVGKDGPGEAYSARERSNYRRRVRRIAERGTLSFAEHGPGPAAADLARRAVDMKRAWIAANGIIAPTVSDPRFQAFFEDMGRDTRGQSQLHVTAIECDGAPIGIDLSFDCKGHCFGHVIAGDPGFEREGIGSVLVHQVFANAKTRGNAVFDLLAPADAYKLAHADDAVAVADIAFPFTLRGRAASLIAIKHLRPAAKALARVLPRRMTRLMARWA